MHLAVTINPVLGASSSLYDKCRDQPCYAGLQLVRFAPLAAEDALLRLSYRSRWALQSLEGGRQQ